jgi:hypothetical protein
MVTVPELDTPTAWPLPPLSLAAIPATPATIVQTHHFLYQGFARSTDSILVLIANGSSAGGISKMTSSLLVKSPWGGMGMAATTLTASGEDIDPFEMVLPDVSVASKY